MTLDEETLIYLDKVISDNFKPAVVVGAEYSGRRVFAHSRPCDSNMRNSLRKKLRELGDLYIPRYGNGNPVGNCAEVNAAQLLMIDMEKLKIEDIIFSTPRRPRTKQPVAICENCKLTFNK
jgi:hypothetical protein